MTKKLVTLLVVLSIALCVVPTVSADTDTGDGTIIVTGQVLDVDVDDFGLTGATLTGAFQTVTTSTDISDWVMIDPTGTGAGWQVNVSTTDFIGQTDNTKTIPYHYTYNGADNYSFRLMVPAITVVDGLVDPDDPTVAGAYTDYTTIDNTPRKIVTAALNDGMGTYSIDPDFELDIPAETYAQTYVAVLTVVISTGP